MADIIAPPPQRVLMRRPMAIKSIRSRFILSFGAGYLCSVPDRIWSISLALRAIFGGR